MKQTFHLALAAPLALALASCGLSPEDRLDRAEEAFAEHRYSEARLDLASVLEVDGRNAEALELLTRTQLALGDGEGAAATLARLDTLGAMPADGAMLLGEADLLRGDFDAVLAAMAEVDSAEAARLTALAHVGLDDLRAAQDAFEAGMARGGDQARLLSDYALFMLAAGDAQAAELLARRALDVAPQALDPLIASARIAETRGDLNAALTHYTEAAERFPESRAAIFGRIGVLGDLGRIAEARPLIEDWAARLPNDLDVTYLQARLVAEDGDWGEVRDMLQPFEASEDMRVQLLYARALIELDLTEQALPRLASLSRRSPGSAEARRLLARAQAESGNRSAALATIRPLANSADGTAADVALLRSLSGSGNGAMAAAPPAERLATLLAQGDAAMRSENWGAAINAYQPLRDWTGDSNALVLNNLAYAHSRAGNLDEAVEMAEAAHRRAPENASIMDTLGWMLVDSGRDRSRGLLLLERAQRAAPDNVVIARHLAEARGR